MTTKDLKLTSNENGKKVKAKNSLTGGFVQEYVETDDEYLDEILHNTSL